MDMHDIITAAANESNAIRNQAEAALKQILTESPDAYFCSLVVELGKDDVEDALRQLAGTQLKIALDSSDEIIKRECRQRWINLSDETRNFVKENIVHVIGSNGPLSRRAAAQVIAKIAAIEITPAENKWPSIVEGLFATASRTDLPDGPRVASLTSLGYILEELDEHEESPLTHEEVNGSLTAICKCMRTPAPEEGIAVSTQVQVAAVIAMLNALPFVAEKFRDDDKTEERDNIMTAVCEATQVDDDEVKASAYQVIARIADLYYANLENYMKVLVDLTSEAAKSDEDAISTAALDFWACIAEEEAELRKDDRLAESKGYIAAAIEPLVALVFEIMVTKQDEHEDGDYGPAEAASAVLKNAALAVGPAIIDALTPYINSNFASEDWQKRNAAVMGFAVMMEDSVDDPAAKEKVRTEIIRPALPHLLTMIVGSQEAPKDPSPLVRSSAAYALSAVFDFHPEVINVAEELEPLLKSFLLSLTDLPVVAKYIAICINNLVDSLESDFPDVFVVSRTEDDDPRSTLISPSFHVIIDALMDRGDKLDAEQQGLRADCYECISRVVEAAAIDDRPVLLAFLENCLQRLSISLGKPADTVEMRDHEYAVQEKLVAMINSIIMKLQEDAAAAAEQIAAMIVHVLSMGNHPASPEALMCACHLAASIGGEEFKRYMPMIHPLLIEYMRNFADYKSCERSIMACADIALKMGPDFAIGAAGHSSPADQVLDLLHKILIDGEIMRSVKPPAIDAVGDIALAIGPLIAQTSPNLGAFLPIIFGAATTAIPDDDEELQEYLMEVRRACMNCYSSIFQAFLPTDVDDMPAGPAKEARKQQGYSLAMEALGEMAMPNLVEVVTNLAREWIQKAEADPQWAPEYALLRKTLAVLCDAGLALGKANIGAFLNLRSDVVKVFMHAESIQFPLHHAQDEDEEAAVVRSDLLRTLLPA